jgi:hypothetical protein
MSRTLDIKMTEEDAMLLREFASFASREGYGTFEQRRQVAVLCENTLLHAVWEPTKHVECISFKHQRRGCTKIATEYYDAEGSPVAFCENCAKREKRIIEQRKKHFAKHPNPPNINHPVARTWGKGVSMSQITEGAYLAHFDPRTR